MSSLLDRPGALPFWGMCLTKLDMGKHTPVALPEARKQPAGVVSISALIGSACVEVRPAYTNYYQSFGDADLELRALILTNAAAGIKRNAVRIYHPNGANGTIETRPGSQIKALSRGMTSQSKLGSGACFHADAITLLPAARRLAHPSAPLATHAPAPRPSWNRRSNPRTPNSLHSPRPAEARKRVCVHAARRCSAALFQKSLPSSARSAGVNAPAQAIRRTA